MPVKSQLASKKSISRIEWRMQDTTTKKIYHQIYFTEERVQWHARKFNKSGMRFNSPTRTQLVKLRSNYFLSFV